MNKNIKMQQNFQHKYGKSPHLELAHVQDHRKQIKNMQVNKIKFLHLHSFSRGNRKSQWSDFS